jgi:hypothetical protein
LKPAGVTRGHLLPAVARLEEISPERPRFVASAGAGYPTIYRIEVSKFRHVSAFGDAFPDLLYLPL